MVKPFVIAISLAAIAAVGPAVAQGLNIPQVPKDAAPTGNGGVSAVTPSDDPDSKDYQNEVLSNPEINDRARAEAAINANSGNTAIVNQSGSSNLSSVIQNGTDNYASQTQKGNANDLRVEQRGAHNLSQESQTGNYNHKVKIQNGNSSEETTIEQAAPPPAN